ncbi:MerR family transcriptional regulator [Actinomycetaceae bacterium TAE3-ERU4]|nr:MerR family transcriptional regulator [Actinomycetaceae bacterium TAE3-ERU4]
MSARALETPVENTSSEPWPRGVSIKPQFSIGNVVTRLKNEFPALSISKVRYLEEQGIVEPARSASGYRKFSAADIERLRYCLTAQRDTFKPISTIRDELKALDAGQEVAVVPVARIVSEDGVAVEPVSGSTVTRRDLEDFSGATTDFLNRLAEVGLLVSDSRGRYPASSVKLVRTLMQLNAGGVPIKNLRFIATFASRLSSILETGSPVTRGRSVEGERQRARSHDLARLATQAAELLVGQEIDNRF